MVNLVHKYVNKWHADCNYFTFTRIGIFQSLSIEEKKDSEQKFLELQRLLNSQEIYSNGLIFSEEELDRLLDRTALYEKMKLL